MGFPIVMGWLGGENMEHFLRTRINQLMITDRLALTDVISPTPKFDAQSLKDLMHMNHVHAAEVTLDDTLKICETFAAAPPSDVTAALLDILDQVCGVRTAWDRHVNLDSRGAQVFTEFSVALRNAKVNDFQHVIDDQSFWLVDFDPALPITTPRGIDMSLPANIELMGRVLISAGERLIANHAAFDAPWGEVMKYRQSPAR
ncbi:MAG: penicillin acylase family protein [Halioglobus sp.]